MSQFLTRFAPSPTGKLHLGHAASAFAVWQAAERAGGDVILRIEDIDTTRCRPAYTEAIYEDLHWLGFKWSPYVRIQSEHFSDYAAVVRQLADLGLAYRCFLTRAQVGEGVFAGKPLHRRAEEDLLDKETPFAWRLSLAAAREHLGQTWSDLSYRLATAAGIETVKADPTILGDIIIARKDTPSAYHIAATHDDDLQSITHVIRGEDLIDAPHVQTLLQVLLGWDQPIYQHHPLIMGPDGKRLSKSHGSIALADLRADGKTPDDIRRLTGFA